MKTIPFLLTGLIPSLVPATFAATTSDSSARADTAAQRLLRHGSIPVAGAGPFVAPGTFRVQVSTKFGRPDLVLADGTWLYHHRRIEGSDAEGTLVVRFTAGRVSSLALVTPAVATAMRIEAQPPRPMKFVATK